MEIVILERMPVEGLGFSFREKLPNGKYRKYKVSLGVVLANGDTNADNIVKRDFARNSQEVVILDMPHGDFEGLEGALISKTYSLFVNKVSNKVQRALGRGGKGVLLQGMKLDVDRGNLFLYAIKNLPNYIKQYTKAISQYVCNVLGINKKSTMFEGMDFGVLRNKLNPPSLLPYREYVIPAKQVGIFCKNKKDVKRAIYLLSSEIVRNKRFIKGYLSPIQTMSTSEGYIVFAIVYNPYPMLYEFKENELPRDEFGSSAVKQYIEEIYIESALEENEKILQEYRQNISDAMEKSLEGKKKASVS